ncbi:MAG: DUF790 family protein [Natronomonas sp.]
MLRKDLLRVSRGGGGYQPQFTTSADEPLAARVIGVYQGHVGETRGALEEALSELEREADDFKLVRGFAALLERESTFETRASIEPRRARTATFEAAESLDAGPAVSESERRAALESAAARLDATVADIEASLFADREPREILTAFETDYDPAALCEQYDLSLAQTALFDATEIRIRSSDPKTLVSAIKRLRLMYEIRQTRAGREVVVTGPDGLFRNARRYGTRFARLLRTLGTAPEWSLEATIDDRGTERTLRLDADDVSVPGTDPVTEVTFDSGVESDFYGRMSALDLDWTLLREPEPLAAGEYAVIPDFAFEWRYPTTPGGGTDGASTVAEADDGSNADPTGFRVFFEIMGFWTPEYVETKLSRFEDLEDVAFVVAYDESLGVGEEIEARGHRAIPYSGTVRPKDVRNALRPYEKRLRARSADALSAELHPPDDAVALSEIATRHGVPEAVLDDVEFPDHELVGRTLIRPAVLEELSGRIESGLSLEDAEEIFEEWGITESSAVLSRLGYRVEWQGLDGGILRT